MRKQTSTSKPDPSPVAEGPAPPVETTEVPGAAPPGRRRRGLVADAATLESPSVTEVDLGTFVETPTAPAGRRRGPAAREARAESEAFMETGAPDEPNPPYQGLDVGHPVRDAVSENLDAQNRKALAMGSGFDAIIDTIFDFDAGDVYDRIKKSLKLSMRASRAEYGLLVDALDEMAQLSSEALQCVANANVAAQRVEFEAQVIEAAMREQAQVQLANNGKAKPTIADIEAHMVSTFHDEVRSLRERRAAVKQTAGMFEQLARVVSERQKDLRQMVASARQAH